MRSRRRLAAQQDEPPPPRLGRRAKRFLWGPHPAAKAKDGFVSRYLNRYLSTPVSSALQHTAITPNQVSVAVSLLALPILVAGWLGHFAAVGVLLQLASVLDGVDGELARAKGLKSPFGALPDTVLDYTVDAVGVMALGLALLRRDVLDPEWALLLVSATIAVRLISQFVVKNTPFPKAHLLGDTRDTVTFILFLAALLAEWWHPHTVVAALLFINVWRLDNMVYRLLVFWRHNAYEASLPVGGRLTDGAPASGIPQVSVDEK